MKIQAQIEVETITKSKVNGCVTVHGRLTSSLDTTKEHGVEPGLVVMTVHSAGQAPFRIGERLNVTIETIKVEE